MRFLLLVCFFSLIFGQNGQLQPPCACTQDVASANREGLDAHGKRCLTDASAAYTRALRLAPPSDPTPAQRDQILTFAPRLMVTANEPFRLKNAAAIMHPTRHWIAYHFFWEDDIDFPDDNDPCDHEVVWVQLNDARTEVIGFYTYFHGEVLRAPQRVLDNARAHGGRVEAYVQWGKHGTLFPGWETTGRLKEYQQMTWKKLSTEGRSSQDSPLGRKWPRKFNGSWEDFNRFTRAVDLAAELKSSG
ncbi:MAG TPA: hypothetical protein VE621_03265, partial [Bryobacteraceae bacterium]|nr:hypothetical protein [Bryobacteraceae bacterium]